MDHQPHGAPLTQTYAPMGTLSAVEQTFGMSPRGG